MIVTYCKSLKEPDIVEHLDLDDVLKSIKMSSKAKVAVENVRNVLEKQGVEAYKKEKIKLGLILFNGKFSYRDKSGFEEGSGYIILDFDNLKNPKQTLEGLKSKSYIYCIFQSVNGKDYKALAKVPKIRSDLEYKVYFNELVKQLPELDRSGSDISRACFISYDPNLYINTNCTTFEIKKENLEVKYWNKVEKVLRKIEEAVDGERHIIRLKISNLFGGWVANGEIEKSTALYLLQKSSLKNTDSDIDTITKTLEDGIANGMKSPLSISEEKRILNYKTGLGKVYQSYDEVEEKVKDFLKKGYTKGVDVGFQSLLDNYSMKKKSTTYFYALPAEGKSQIVYEICVNVAYKYGWNFAILSPETGDVEEVFSEILSVVMKTSISEFQFTAQDYEIASAFVRQHFYVIDPLGKDFCLVDMLDQVGALERQYEVKIDSIVIDPLNYLDVPLDGRREDIAQGKDLDLFLADAKKNDRHNIIITHVRDLPLRNVKGKGDEDVKYSYFPMPTPNDVANGRMFFRKGFMMVAIYRPRTTKGEPLEDENGYTYPKNTTLFVVQKVKPKGTGTLSITPLYFDVKRNRFYELVNGENSYAWEFENVKQSLNKYANEDFSEVVDDSLF